MKTTEDHMDRRQFLTSAGLLAATMIVAPRSLFAQNDSPVTKIIGEARKSAITATKLRGDLTLLEGSGGNIVLLSGKKGNLMVDAGIDVSKEKIKTKIASINNVPLLYLINTHWHFDHASGNQWIGREGAKIIAHQNTAKWLSRRTRVDDWNYTFPAAPKDAIPTSLFADGHQLDFEGHVIHLKHYTPAHTDSDIFVHFQAVDVLHVADTWWNGYYPFIDYNTGGNIHGMIKAAEQNIQMTSPSTLIVPGHGPVGKKADLIRYRDMLVSIERAVSKLKKSGMSLKEVVAARPTKKFDDKWGKFVIGPDFFTALVYKGIS
ncbi:MBL fold metallo-hydrolase [Mucilaginibacter gynuensis]|uniref:MBL fold metallo-hydrolase n=1 Tax=Mucilaginibacter gynuensis TaxID=1302236 RepID=A0ABP8G6A7_9SPHI